MIRTSSAVWTVLLAILAMALIPHSAYAIERQAQVHVTIHVPVVQKLTLLEPVTFTLPAHTGTQAGPILFEQVGKMRVISNAPWTLVAESSTDLHSNILVKASGDAAARWTPVAPQAPVYHGQPGAHELSWDIRVEPSHVQALLHGGETVQLLFTLMHI